MKAHTGVHQELEVYQKALDAAMRVFELSKTLPKEESHALTEPIRRSSRSVCTHLAEAWRKRRWEDAFVAKLADAESEAAGTQVWLEFAAKSGYFPADDARELYRSYNAIIAAIDGMIQHPESWLMVDGEKRNAG
jgi:four helix bundle protein